MEAFYYVLFALLAATAATLELGKGGASRSALSGGGGGGGNAVTREFAAFRSNYVLVYALMMAGDWLQGPYVYALYQHYGFNRGDIGRLFIAGFASSMVFGTIVGSLADRTGRKKAALTYVLVYSLGCFTKHSSSFAVLLGGRLLCGVATSLLYSAFEAWLVAEHFQRGYAADLLGGTFARAVLVGNGLVAIVAGLVAQTLVGALKLGPVAPFDAAAAVLAAGGVVIATTWTENYGERAPSPATTTTSGGGGGGSPPPPPPSPLDALAAQLKAGAAAIAADPKVALLGAEQALFEGAMYTFVFLWTPALAPNGEAVPHGFVFALFMVACMAGSAFAGRLLAGGVNGGAGGGGKRPEQYMQAVFLAAAGALSVPVVVHALGISGGSSSPPPKGAPPRGLSGAGRLLLLAFCAFEALVGVFWPSMMKMRATYVPEGTRATVTNMFRIPLNAFVCVALYNVSAYPLWGMFGMCAAFLGVAAACQRRLAAIVAAEAAAGAGAGAGAVKMGAIGSGAGAQSVTASPGPPAGRRV